MEEARHESKKHRYNANLDQVQEEEKQLQDDDHVQGVSGWEEAWGLLGVGNTGCLLAETLSSVHFLVSVLCFSTTFT